MVGNIFCFVLGCLFGLVTTSLIVANKDYKDFEEFETKKKEDD